MDNMHKVYRISLKLRVISSLFNKTVANFQRELASSKSIIFISYITYSEA